MEQAAAFQNKVLVDSEGLQKSFDKKIKEVYNQLHDHLHHTEDKLLKIDQDRRNMLSKATQMNKRMEAYIEEQTKDEKRKKSAMLQLFDGVDKNITMLDAKIQDTNQRILDQISENDAMKRKAKSNEQLIESIMGRIQEEYIEFFKNKKQMKIQLGNHYSNFDNQLNSLLGS